MTATMRSDGTSGAHAEVNYVWNPPTEPGVTLTLVTEAEEHSTMRTLPGRSVWITNARSLRTDLDREGFLLVAHVSAIEGGGCRLLGRKRRALGVVAVLDRLVGSGGACGPLERGLE
jgi:hypothetical protein